jgi:hypothetical protein
VEDVTWTSKGTDGRDISVSSEWDFFAKFLLWKKSENKKIV